MDTPRSTRKRKHSNEEVKEKEEKLVEEEENKEESEEEDNDDDKRVTKFTASSKHRQNYGTTKDMKCYSPDESQELKQYECYLVSKTGAAKSNEMAKWHLKMIGKLMAFVNPKTPPSFLQCLSKDNVNRYLELLEKGKSVGPSGRRSFVKSVCMLIKYAISLVKPEGQEHYKYSRLRDHLLSVSSMLSKDEKRIKMEKREIRLSEEMSEELTVEKYMDSFVAIEKLTCGKEKEEMEEKKKENEEKGGDEEKGNNDVDKENIMEEEKEEEEQVESDTTYAVDADTSFNSDSSTSSPLRKKQKYERWREEETNELIDPPINGKTPSLSWIKDQYSESSVLRNRTAKEIQDKYRSMEKASAAKKH